MYVFIILIFVCDFWHDYCTNRDIGAIILVFGLNGFPFPREAFLWDINDWLFFHFHSPDQQGILALRYV